MIGYDDWKTTPAEPDRGEEECCHCGCPLYEGNECYRIEWEVLCPECMRDIYRRIV